MTLPVVGMTVVTILKSPKPSVMQLTCFQWFTSPTLTRLKTVSVIHMQTQFEMAFRTFSMKLKSVPIISWNFTRPLLPKDLSKKATCSIRWAWAIGITDSGTCPNTKICKIMTKEVQTDLFSKVSELTLQAFTQPPWQTLPPGLNGSILLTLKDY